MLIPRNVCLPDCTDGVRSAPAVALTAGPDTLVHACVGLIRGWKEGRQQMPTHGPRFCGPSAGRSRDALRFCCCAFCFPALVRPFAAVRIACSLLRSFTRMPLHTGYVDDRGEGWARRLLRDSGSTAAGLTPRCRRRSQIRPGLDAGRRVCLLAQTAESVRER